MAKVFTKKGKNLFKELLFSLRSPKGDLSLTGLSAIELDAKSIKIAQSALIQGKRKITSLFFAKDLETEEAKNTIKDKIRKSGIEIDECLLSLPRHNVTTRYLKLPSQDEKEIGKMVKLQIPKLLPYAADDIVSSFKIISSDAAGYNYCVVILAQQNLVRHLCSFLDSIGIKLTKVILSSEGAVNFITNLKKDSLKGEALILVDVDFASADIIIIKNSQLVFTRTILWQPPNPSDKSSWQSKLQDEVNRSIEIANKEVVLPKIDGLIITGSESIIRDSDKGLSLNFSFPIKVISLLDNELVKGNPQVEEVLKTNDVSFTSVIGAVLNKDKFSLDLMPIDIKDKLGLRILRRESRRLLVSLALVIFLLFGLFLKHIYDKSRLLKIIERKIKILSPQTSAQGEISARFETLREQLRQPIFVSELLKQIYNIIPDDLSLTSLNIERDKVLTLKGQTGRFATVFNLVSLLEKNEYFKNAKLRYVSKRKIKDLELTDFQIDCALKKK